MEISALADHMDFIDEIADLHQAEWEHLDPSITLEKRKAALTQAAGREGIPAIYVAHLGNEFIGSVALVEDDMRAYRPELSPWIASVFVKEKWRAKGVASKLVTYGEERAAKANVSRLYLFTESSTGFYLKLGWQKIEHCEYMGVQVDVKSKALISE